LSLSLSLSRSHMHTHSLTHSLSLTLSFSLSLSLSLFLSFFLFLCLSLFHTLSFPFFSLSPFSSLFFLSLFSLSLLSLSLSLLFLLVIFTSFSSCIACFLLFRHYCYRFLHHLPHYVLAPVVVLSLSFSLSLSPFLSGHVQFILRLAHSCFGRTATAATITFL